MYFVYILYSIIQAHTLKHHARNLSCSYAIKINGLLSDNMTAIGFKITGMVIMILCARSIWLVKDSYIDIYTYTNTTHTYMNRTIPFMSHLYLDNI